MAQAGSSGQFFLTYRLADYVYDLVCSNCVDFSTFPVFTLLENQVMKTNTLLKVILYVLSFSTTVQLPFKNASVNTSTCKCSIIFGPDDALDSTRVPLEDEVRWAVCCVEVEDLNA